MKKPADRLNTKAPTVTVKTPGDALQKSLEQQSAASQALDASQAVFAVEQSFDEAHLASTTVFPPTLPTTLRQRSADAGHVSLPPLQLDPSP